jgi:hypothetical protein
MATQAVARNAPRMGKKQIFLYVSISYRTTECAPALLRSTHIVLSPRSILFQLMSKSHSPNCSPLCPLLTPSTPRPNFTLTLLRTPTHPPTFASFIVPLNLNKLDLRDYLYNAYGISVRGVRSYIQMQKLRQDKPSAKRPHPRRWFRPRSIKKMMVEMDKPFVWPEEPTNLDLYDYLFHCKIGLTMGGHILAIGRLGWVD